MIILEHNEKINDDIIAQIENKNHYLGNNPILPTLEGGISFLTIETQKCFEKVVNKMKRVFNIEEIDPTTFYKLKSEMLDVMDQIHQIESENSEYIKALTEFILKKVFQTEDFVDFEIKLATTLNDDLLQEGLNFKMNLVDKPESYSQIKEVNNQLYRDQLLQSLVCGGANCSMNLFKLADEELDSLDYRLYNLYEKYVTFNEFYMWVTPDQYLKISETGDLMQVIYQEDKSIIDINAENLPAALYQGSKALLKLLWREGVNRAYVSLNDPWNARVGILMWNKFVDHVRGDNLSKVFKALVDLPNEDFQMVMNELLADTMYASKIFTELNDHFLY